MRIEDIAENVRGCRDCALFRRCKGPVPGVGRASARLMVVGQAPGWEEDREGVPWIGQAGQFLTDILEYTGWPADRIYFTNLTKCYPGRQSGGDKEPPQEAIEACTKHLRRELDAVRPDLILVVGAISARFFGIRGGINKNSGKVFESKWGPVMPLIHPASLMRPGRKRDVPIFATLLWRINTFFSDPVVPPRFSPVEEWLEERGYAV